MQDLKHLLQKKSPGFTFFGYGSRNRRLKPVDGPARLRLSLPSGKRLRLLKPTLLFIAIVLAVTPLSVLALRQTK
jgi:hypothetical protein